MEETQRPGRTERSSRKARAAPPDLVNTPAVASGHVRLFAELLGDPAVQATRWFIVSVVLGGVIIALVALLFSLFPLKQPVPYMVETGRDGAVARVVEASSYKPTQAMVKAAVAQWVEKVMVIDPYLTRRNLRDSTLLLRGKATAQHKELLEADDVFRRLLQTPGLTRTIDINGVDVSQDGIAFVFCTTTERVTSGAPLIQKWRFTLHYTVSPPTDEQQIIANPTGLNITHIERVQDKS